MTLPTAEAVLEGYPFVARRHGLDAWISETGVRGALAEAAALATSAEAAEPAALFFAFARRPRMTRGAWVALAVVLAANQARAIGSPIRAVPRGELRALATRIAAREIDFDGVRAWFGERMTRSDAP